MNDYANIRAQVSLVDTIARYTDVRRVGGEYRALCVFHDDKTPSLTIYRGGDGIERYRCFACGAGSEGGDCLDFLAAIEGCTIAEAAAKLTGGALPALTVTPPKLDLPPDESKLWVPIIPVPADAPPYDPAHTFNPRRGMTVAYQPERVDTYRDAKGKIICHVARMRFKDGKKFTPCVTYCAGPQGAHRWCTRRMPPPYPLLGLDELARRPGDWVLLVEGERKRASLQALLPAMVVMSFMGGAEAAAHADLEPLRRRQVTLWPDADAPGIAAMHNIGGRLA